MLVENGKRFVAFFDLLGFSSWLRADGSAEVFSYVRGFLNLLIRASLPGSVVHADMSVTVQDSDIGFINFSDSIVFYSRDESDSCLETMLRVCGEFMNSVITGPSRMMRGAMSYGEFYADPEANAYVGQALVDAYKLEGMQDWLGFSFAESVANLPQFKRALMKNPTYIVRSLVPLRDTTIIPYCLNWADKHQGFASLYSTRYGLASCEQRARKALVDNPTELEKLERRIKHTKEFILHFNEWNPSDLGD